MWIYIKGKSYNFNHILQVSGEVTKLGKTYLSLIDTRGVEVRIQLGLDEIENILNTINDEVFGDLELLK
jgi:hypothetical protein